MTQEEYFEEGEPQTYKKPYESVPFPVTSDQQLGQEILRTFARVSDPPVIVMRKIRKRVPVFDTKTVTDEKGKERDLEYIEKWEIQEWEFPILVQPKYHELITDDISRGFLNEGDLEVARTMASYCDGVKSFADRYGLDLSLHHNNMVDEIQYLVVSSGAFQGKRVQLAKTNIAEQTYRQSTYQMTEEGKRRKKGLIDGIINP